MVQNVQSVQKASSLHTEQQPVLLIARQDNKNYLITHALGVMQAHFQQTGQMNVLRVQKVKRLLKEQQHVFLVARQAITKMVQNARNAKKVKLQH